MANSQPQDHLLITSDCMRRVPVWILAAAATFTRRSPEFNPGPIVEGATLAVTLLQLGNLRTGILLYMMRGTILGQKLLPIDLWALLTLYVGILVAVVMCSLTGESMNFGSGVVTNTCRLQ